MRYGRINHVCILVEDFDEASERYGKLFGIRHWYMSVTDPGSLKVRYKGEEKHCDIRIYYGGKGFTKLELIESKGDRNIYDVFREKHGEAFHHIMYNTRNLDKTLADFDKRGFKVLQTAEFTSGGAKIRYAYVGPSEDGPVIEFVECRLIKNMKKGDMFFEIPVGRITGSYKKVK